MGRVLETVQTCLFSFSFISNPGLADSRFSLVLPRGVPPRNCLPATGHLHHIRVHQVLAAVPGPGRVHGPRQRLSLLSHGGNRVDVFQQEEGARHRHDGLWQRDRGADLPCHGKAASADHWVPLDHQGDWIHPDGEPGGCQHRAQAQDPAQEGRGAGRVGCFSGARVYLLRGRELHCEFGLFRFPDPQKDLSPSEEGESRKQS